MMTSSGEGAGGVYCLRSRTSVSGIGSYGAQHSTAAAHFPPSVETLPPASAAEEGPVDCSAGVAEVTLPPDPPQL